MAAAHDVPSVAHGADGGVTVVLPPDPDSVSMEGDSVTHDSAAAEEIHPVAEEAAATEPEVPEEKGAVQGAAQGAADSASTPVASPVPTEGGSTGSASVPKRAAVPLNPEGAKKLAKIFGAMKAVDAAAVLAEMTDEEVEAVLGQMNDRTAAPILVNFPADRAAKLSREVLRGRGGS